MKLSVELVKKITEAHDERWEEVQKRQQGLARLYDVKYWREESSPELPFVNIADAQGFVQSFQSNLFDLDPAVTILPGLESKGDAKTAESVSNAWLKIPCIRSAVQEASMIAMVHPHAAIRLWAEPESKSLLKRVRIGAVRPWDLLVDGRTNNWDEQRWVGVRFSLPITEVKDRWGKDITRSHESIHQSYLQEGWYGEDPEVSPELYEVDIWEIHCHGYIYYWSPCCPMEFLSRRKSSFVNPDGDVFVPIYPLYYKRSAQRNLLGIGLLETVMSQMEEKTLLRTYMARSIRGIARIYATRKGLMDEQAELDLAAGVDGTLLKLDLRPEESPRDALIPLPTTPLSSEAYNYHQALDNDIAKATPVAPFVRGEAIKSTATEITVLTQYSAADLKALGSVKDQMTAEMTQGFLWLLAPMAKKTPIRVGTDLIVLTEDALKGDFQIYCSDSANTPLARAQVKAETMQLLPILQQFPSFPEALRKHIGDVFDLPAELIEGMAEQAQHEQVMPDAGVPDAGVPEDMGQPETAPGQMAQMLGNLGM